MEHYGIINKKGGNPMKRKRNICISIVLLLVLAILFIPIPKKIEQKLYATETQSGEQATLSIDLTFLRFLILEDKMFGNISFENGKQNFVFDCGLSKSNYSVYPTNNEDKEMHVVNGFWYDEHNYTHNGCIAYISIDFDKAMFTFNDSYGNNREYIANIEKNKEVETCNYFKGFVDNPIEVID